MWIEPLSEFGAGNVQLTEIPAESDTNSNCIAHWPQRRSRRRQGTVLEPTGSSGAGAARPAPRSSRSSIPGGRGSAAKRRRFVVAFTGDALGDAQSLREPKPALSVFSGSLASMRSYLYRDRKLYRVVFEFDPGGSRRPKCAW